MAIRGAGRAQLTLLLLACAACAVPEARQERVAVDRWDDGTTVAVDSSGVSFLLRDGSRLDLGLVRAGREGDLRDVSRGVLATGSGRIELSRGSITEWYLATPHGTEQGFDIHARPPGVGDVVLELEAPGAGRIELGPDGRTVRLRPRGSRRVVSYSHLHVMDADRRPLVAALEIDGRRIRIRLDDRGARYPIVVDPIMSTQSDLEPADLAVQDQYGSSVAISGDTVVVGSPWDDDTGSASGSAYVFVRSGTSWSQQQKLTASDGASYSFFGTAVAIDGDTIVIGARQADAPETDSGAAYVFVRSGTTWTEQAKLTASDGAENEWYGASVAISGDTILVGCGSHTHGGVSSGAAYVYVRSGTAWTEQQELRAGGAGNRFGAAVAVDGDTAVVGADGYSSSAGIAYVFVRSGTTWAQQSTLSGSGLTPSDYFGRSVAVEGDNALVGSAEYNPGGVTVAGAGFVFVRSGTTWTQQARLLATGPVAWDRVGSSVALSGDFAVLGATGRDGAAAESGAALVFVRAGTTWTQEGTLTGSGGLGSDLFGTSVGLDGRTAVVGAPGNDEVADRAGAAYVFHFTSEDGSSCTADADCASGYCSDNVCCDGACGGSAPDCQACSVATGATTDGVCATLPAGHLCRPTAGDCDVAESCDGTSTACPSDVFLPAVITCRTSADTCDAAETCTGSSATCPSDAPAADGTPCSDGMTCNGDDQCVAGTCTAGSGLDCDDDDTCTADTCSEPSGCMHAPIAGCCNNDADCDDGDVCTTNRCPTPGGTCAFAPITGCCVADAECDDTSDCTTDACNTGTNRCEHTPVAGCCTTAADCEDTDPCTADACDTSDGTCSRIAIAECCSSDGDCDDGDVCTSDGCPSAGVSCEYEPIAGCCEADTDCDDGDACTVDACDTLTFRCESEPDPACTTDAGTDAAVADAGALDAAATDGAAADGGGGPRSDGGCGCHVASPRPPGWPLALALALSSLAFRRRRPRRNPRA